MRPLSQIPESILWNICSLQFAAPSLSKAASPSSSPA